MSRGNTFETDVLIVGSGAVGVTAAIEAAEAGARVIALEREDHLGGAAAISGGGCCLVDTPLQRRSGIEDSTDLAFNDWIGFGGGAADEVWARFYIEHSLQDLYRWAEDRGVRWMRLIHQEGSSVPRWHQPENGGGGMWRVLHRWAVSRGADRWITSTAVKELITDNGRIAGVLTENTQTGQTQEFYARAVVMGTGGFSSNLDMIHQYRPDLKKYRILEGGHIGARGDGHRIVEKAGGVLTHMGALWTYAHAIPNHNNPRRGFVVRIMGFPWLWVNMQGRRFHDESLHSGASGTPALLAQEPAECWAVIDGTVFDAVMVSAPEFYQENTSNPAPAKIRRLIEESPHIVKADTLAELGSRMQVPVEPFLDSIRLFNQDIEGGLERDSAFGRPLAGLSKMEQPPFYAFHFAPLARKTLGGVKTDLHCRVLSKYYEPIPGLYAAGELAGMAGGHINGKACLEGTMLGPSLFSGRVAGAWAAAEAGFGEGFVRKARRES